MRWITRGVVSMLLVEGVACGGTAGTSGATGTGGAAGSSSDWRQRCQKVVDQNALCAKSSRDSVAVESCVATQSCVPAVWSANVVDASMTCLAVLACNHPDDECISATASQQTPTKQALFTACQTKATACPSFTGCLETLFLVSDELALTLRACLEQACDAAASCMLNEYLRALTAAGCAGELPFGG